MPDRIDERKRLLAEIRRLGRQAQAPGQALLERYMQCPETKLLVSHVENALQRSRGSRPHHAPSTLLPWLG